jgi:predicted amidohydrolase
MSRNVTVAATQMACSWDLEGNIEVAERLVREAAAKGAQIILIQELFEAPYFCQKPNPDYLQLATTVEDNVAIKHFQKVARELQVVLPISFYELAGRARFNSIAIIDADGSNLGIYRKSHIPDGPGYHEKYYFNPGDTGFKVWNTRYANRIGNEEQDGYDITFYGSSFIANQLGEKVQELNETEEGVLVHTFDLDQLEHIRSAWGSFRDRRPNLYGALKTLDGTLES